MEIFKQINLLQNPHISAKSLDYVKPVNIYINLFEIKFAKEIKMYMYPFIINPTIDVFELKIRKNLFKEIHEQILNIYGIYLIDGNSLYSLQKVEESHTFMTATGNQHKIKIKKYENMKIINERDINNNSLPKKFIELMIKDILASNPNIERFKDTYIMLNKKEKIDIDKSLSFDYYSGFKFDLVDTDLGKLVNLSLAHKLICNENILEYMEKFGNLKNRTVQLEIERNLIGRSFKDRYRNNKIYKISDILWDRTPMNQTFNYNSKVITFKNYYEQEYKTIIKNKEQPLILARKENNRRESYNFYCIPELCNLIGIDEENLTDIKFMEKISEYTRLGPNNRVNEMNKFIELLEDNTKNEKTNWSSKEKTELYGIQIKSIKNYFLLIT